MPQNNITVDCPHCGDKITVVVPVQNQEQAHSNQQESGEDAPTMNAELLSHEEIEPTQPYSGRDEEIPIEQCMRAEISIDGASHRFTFWYTPERDGYKYIVRGELDSGSKMKTVYQGGSEGPFFTDRGVPKSPDKKWTYLDEEECRRRAKIAGLGEIRSTSEPDRHQIPIIESKEGLEDNEELLLQLAKGLTVFQTADY